jgi:predicted phosphodiesterase
MGSDDIKASDFEEEQAKADAKRNPKKVIGKLAELLERSNIDVTEIDRINRINVWQGMYVDKDGEAHTVDMAGIQLVPNWNDGPKWPVVQPAKPTVVKAVGSSSKPTKLPQNWKRAVIFPDIQIGFYRDREDNLVSTHDEVAIDLALQVTRDANPDVVVMIGDNTDFPELGKYRKHPSFVRTTQATIDRCGLLAAQIRANAPNAKIFWIAGNHEERLPNYIVDNAVAAYGLRRANAPESWPVLSVPVLCNLDEYDITFVPGWPANRVWLNNRLQVVHGDVTTNGSTAHKYLNRERVSTIYGHVHRREWAEKTRITEDGPRTILAASPGCLCKLNGIVPSTKTGYNLHGEPIETCMDWQQGLAVVDFYDGDGPFRYDPVPIHEQEAFWDGNRYSV